LALTGTSKTSPATSGTIATELRAQRRALWRAPVHRHEQADQQQQQDEDWRDLPEQVEANDL
jgi:hypothetical protein